MDGRVVNGLTAVGSTELQLLLRKLPTPTSPSTAAFQQIKTLLHSEYQGMQSVDLCEPGALNEDRLVRSVFLVIAQRNVLATHLLPSLRSNATDLKVANIIFSIIHLLSVGPPPPPPEAPPLPLAIATAELDAIDRTRRTLANPTSIAAIINAVEPQLASRIVAPLSKQGAQLIELFLNIIVGLLRPPPLTASAAAAAQHRATGADAMGALQATNALRSAALAVVAAADVLQMHALGAAAGPRAAAWFASDCAETKERAFRWGLIFIGAAGAALAQAAAADAADALAAPQLKSSAQAPREDVDESADAASPDAISDPDGADHGPADRPASGRGSAALGGGGRGRGVSDAVMRMRAAMRGASSVGAGRLVSACGISSYESGLVLRKRVSVDDPHSAWGAGGTASVLLAAPMAGRKGAAGVDEIAKQRARFSKAGRALAARPLAAGGGSVRCAEAVGQFAAMLLNDVVPSLAEHWFIDILAAAGGTVAGSPVIAQDVCSMFEVCSSLLAVARAHAAAVGPNVAPHPLALYPGARHILSEPLVRGAFNNISRITFSCVSATANKARPEWAPVVAPLAYLRECVTFVVTLLQSQRVAIEFPAVRAAATRLASAVIHRADHIQCLVDCIVAAAGHVAPADVRRVGLQTLHVVAACVEALASEDGTVFVRKLRRGRDKAHAAAAAQVDDAQLAEFEAEAEAGDDELGAVESAAAVAAEEAPVDARELLSVFAQPKVVAVLVDMLGDAAALDTPTVTALTGALERLCGPLNAPAALWSLPFLQAAQAVLAAVPVTAAAGRRVYVTREGVRTLSSHDAFAALREAARLAVRSYLTALNNDPALIVAIHFAPTVSDVAVAQRGLLVDELDGEHEDDGDEWGRVRGQLAAAARARDGLDADSHSESGSAARWQWGDTVATWHVDDTIASAIAHGGAAEHGVAAVLMQAGCVWRRPLPATASARYMSDAVPFAYTALEVPDDDTTLQRAFGIAPPDPFEDPYESLAASRAVGGRGDVDDGEPDAVIDPRAGALREAVLGTVRRSRRGRLPATAADAALRLVCADEFAVAAAVSDRVAAAVAMAEVDDDYGGVMDAAATLPLAVVACARASPLAQRILAGAHVRLQGDSEADTAAAAAVGTLIRAARAAARAATETAEAGTAEDVDMAAVASNRAASGASIAAVAAAVAAAGSADGGDVDAVSADSAVGRVVGGVLSRLAALAALSQHAADPAADPVAQLVYNPTLTAAAVTRVCADVAAVSAVRELLQPTVCPVEGDLPPADSAAALRAVIADPAVALADTAAASLVLQRVPQAAAAAAARVLDALADSAVVEIDAEATAAVGCSATLSALDAAGVDLVVSADADSTSTAAASVAAPTQMSAAACATATAVHARGGTRDPLTAVLRRVWAARLRVAAAAVAAEESAEDVARERAVDAAIRRGARRAVVGGDEGGASSGDDGDIAVDGYAIGSGFNLGARPRDIVNAMPSKAAAYEHVDVGRIMGLSDEACAAGLDPSLDPRAALDGLVKSLHGHAREIVRRALDEHMPQPKPRRRTRGRAASVASSAAREGSVSDGRAPSGPEDDHDHRSAAPSVASEVSELRPKRKRSTKLRDMAAAVADGRFPPVDALLDDSAVPALAEPAEAGEPDSVEDTSAAPQLVEVSATAPAPTLVPPTLPILAVNPASRMLDDDE